MTSPAPSGPSRRRVAGLALVGVGIIAAIIGLASLALNNGGGGDPAAAPPPGSESATAAPGTPGAPGGETPGAPAPTSAPPASGQPDPNQVGVPSFPATPTNGVAAPGQPGADQGGTNGVGANGSGGTGDGAGGSGGGGAGGGDAAVTAAPVRVYNNSQIPQLADEAAGDFRNAGFQVDEVGNYSSARDGLVYETTAYYRPGTGEQATAEALGERFGMRVNPRFSGLDDASPGVIVIVTKEYTGA